MNRTTIIEKLQPLMAQEFETDAALMLPDAPLRETLDLDSLDIVDVIVLIEHTCGVKLQKSDFSTLKTFDDLYKLIETHL